MEQKFETKKVFVLGSGFMGIMLLWTFYNTFVPVLLEGFVKSAAVIGLIMTLDNFLALTIQPIAGAMSDKTDTRKGRRMPYLLFGAPLAALFFAAVPFSSTLILMIALIIGMNVFMAVFRSPLIALMPDIVPSEGRSKANGIINLMGGLGALIALFAGGMLFDADRALSFILVAVSMLLAVYIVVFRIKEPERSGSFTDADESETPWKLIKITLVGISLGTLVFFGVPSIEGVAQWIERSFDNAFHGRLIVSFLIFTLIVIAYVRRILPPRAIFVFLAVFFWFFGYNSIETFFSLYGKNVLGIKPGQASMILGVFSISFIIFALPAGLVAGKLGRKRTIIMGLLVLIISVFAVGFSDSLVLIYLLMFIGGAGWAAININSYPMVCDMAPGTDLGTFTGLYYFFSMLAQTLSPPFSGMLIDSAGDYNILFLIAPTFFLLAFICILFVKGGEVVNKSVQ